MGEAPKQKIFSRDKASIKHESSINNGFWGPDLAMYLLKSPK